MDNPKTPLELADAIGNLLGQLRIALMIGDMTHVEEALDRAAAYCHTLTDDLQQ